MQKILPLHRQPKPHKELWRRHHEHWSKSHLAATTILSIVGFLLSIFVLQPYAINFANDHAGGSAPDLILSNIPVFDVGLYFVYGMFAFVAVITILCLARPARAPLILNSLTLFILIRSMFVSLTHIGPFPTHAVSTFSDGITRAFFGADLFFSGHTGAPFLMALIFWEEPRLRYLFLCWSVFFAAVVLTGHLHYSIDVFAAFFITYGIYHLSLWLFPKSAKLFLSSETP